MTLVDVRPGRSVFARWKLMASGAFHSEGDEDRLRLALNALFQAQPAHQDIAGVRVEFAQVSVELVEVSVETRYGSDDDCNEA
ncbi:hypothetical protein [Streptomyces sp. NPDC004270]